MIIKSRQDDGSVVSYESAFFPPLDVPQGGKPWRVTLRMNGTDYPVTVRWINPRTLCTEENGQHYLAEGIEEVKLWW